MNTVPIVAALISASATTVAALLAIVVGVLRERGRRRRERRADACAHLLDVLADYSTALYRLGLDAATGLRAHEDQLVFDIRPEIDAAVHQGRVSFQIARARMDDQGVVDAALVWERRCEAHSLGDPGVSAADVQRAFDDVVRRATVIMRRDRRPLK